MVKSSLKLTLMLSFACNTALAAQGAPLGPFRVFPEIGVDLKHDDNVLLAPDDEESSFLTVLRPQARLVNRQRAQTYALTLGADIGRYDSTESDNYEDMRVEGRADWRFIRRASFSLDAHYRLGHDRRGSTDRGDAGEPDTWSSTGVRGTFGYGQRERIGVEAEVGYVAKRYKEFFLDEKIDDKDDTDIVGRVFYRVLPKTRVFLEASYAMTEYDISSGARSDSDAYNVSLGATWAATAKTTGTAKVGYLERDYDASDFDDFSGANWQVGVQWKPLRRSTVDFYTGRRTTDTTGIGSFLDTQDVSVSWTHRWIRHLSTTAGIYFAQTDFPGGIREELGLSERSDDTVTYNLAVNYDVLRWASVGAGVNFTDRDSNVDTEDYDQSVFFVTLNAAF